jgi:hypothetical protein
VLMKQTDHVGLVIRAREPWITRSAEGKGEWKDSHCFRGRLSPARLGARRKRSRVTFLWNVSHRRNVWWEWPVGISPATGGDLGPTTIPTTTAL